MDTLSAPLIGHTLNLVTSSISRFGLGAGDQDQRLAGIMLFAMTRTYCLTPQAHVRLFSSENSSLTDHSAFIFILSFRG